MIEFVSIQEFSLACIIYVATIAANNEEVRLLIPRLTEGPTPRITRPGPAGAAAAARRGSATLAPIRKALRRPGANCRSVSFRMKC